LPGAALRLRDPFAPLFPAHIQRRVVFRREIAHRFLSKCVASKRLQKFKYYEGERRQNEREPQFCKPTQAPDAKRSHCVRHQRQSVQS
jgi:hypothetical protein